MSETFDRAEHCRQIGFKPGQSGNPGGKKPGTQTLDVAYWAKKRTREAIDSLAAIARNPESKDADRIAAWREILDRGHGRPAQSIGIELLQREISKWSLDDARKALALFDAVEAIEDKTIEVNAEPASDAAVTPTDGEKD